MASTNSDFKRFLSTFDEDNIITVELGGTPPPILSDVVIGQWIHLVVIYASMMIAYVYTAGYIVGVNARELANASFNMGHTFGTFIHQLNDNLTLIAVRYLSKPKVSSEDFTHGIHGCTEGVIDPFINHSTTGGAYEQH